MLVLLRRTSFLTTFYGLYFSYLHIILQICCWASEGSFHVLLQLLSIWLVGTPQASVSMLLVDSSYVVQITELLGLHLGSSTQHPTIWIVTQPFGYWTIDIPSREGFEPPPAEFNPLEFDWRLYRPSHHGWIRD